MLALRRIGVHNDPAEVPSIHIAMAPRMAPTSATFTAATKPSQATGRIAARPLTDAAIRALRDGESRTDGSLPVGAGRLIIECKKSRSALRRRWVFRYRTATTSRKMLLGDYPGLSLEEARCKARGHIEQVRSGVDPQLAAFERKQSTIRAERRTW
jgi:hypothetical protein